MADLGDERLRITYQLTCGPGEDPDAKTQDLVFEQTVELPEQCVPDLIREWIVGDVEAVESLGSSRARAVVSYDPIVVGDDFPQLLNLLFGNISLKQGILVTDVNLPPSMLDRFAGPRWGIEGVRALCGATEERALLCAAVKPLGSSAKELAELCYRFASSGMDIVKDDHGLVDQLPARFEERVRRCHEAVANANEQSGGQTLYVPNLTAGASLLEKRLELVTSLGCRAVLISPLLVGLDTVRWIASECGLAIFAHPAMTGAFFQEDHGIAAHVLLGSIFRMIGSDGVIYPNVGGRFSHPSITGRLGFSQDVCEAINRHLRQPLGALRPSFPVPAGGIDANRIPHWIRRYGVDTIFLIGSSLYDQPDLEQASRRLVEAVRQYEHEESVDSR